MDEKFVNRVRPEGYPVEPAQGSVMGVASGGSRMSGKAYLLAEASRLRRKADSYEALASQIPDGWPHSADEALWNLVSDARR